MSEPIRSETGVSRRTFLRGAAGSLALLAVQAAFRLDLQAQQEALEGFQFFTHEEAEIFEAVAARIWPGDEDDPGAREAGVVYYVDRALAGPYAQYQQAYRVALDELAQTASQRFGSSLRDLEGAQLDTLLAEFEEREDDLDAMPGRELELGLGPASAFEMFRKHTMEGVFSDPIYGGNRNYAGWRVVDYPGAHYIYTAEEQQTFEPLSKPFQSLADL